MLEVEGSGEDADVRPRWRVGFRPRLRLAPAAVPQVALSDCHVGVLAGLPLVRLSAPAFSFRFEAEKDHRMS